MAPPFKQTLITHTQGLFVCNIVNSLKIMRLKFREFCILPYWRRLYFHENHWSNETTMLQFLDNVIIPYISHQQEVLQSPDQAALVIFDVYAAHRTDSVTKKLLDNNIRYCQVPAACTDKLQPLDLSFNKEYKHALKHWYNQWYADHVAQQIDNTDDEDQIRTVKVDTRMTVIKPLHANWIIDVHQEMANKNLILDGFKKAGIINEC